MEHSNYCAAYELKRLREYPGWSERAENARVDKQEVDGKEIEVRRELTDDSIVYIHDSYIVTDGIYKDMNLLFDDVTDAWKEFCHSTLGFEIPVYEPIEIQVAPEPAAETAEQPATEGT
jgi:hypothetical protein